MIQKKLFTNIFFVRICSDGSDVEYNMRCVCMYVCMCVSMYVCMYICMYVCTDIELQYEVCMYGYNHNTDMYI